MKPNVLAVVVTYHPDRPHLYSLLRELLRQARAVLVVDNTPALAEDSGLLEVEAIEGARLIALGCNQGIAAAQNIGVSTALAEDFAYLLLCDQDSWPLPGMVDTLAGVTQSLQEQGIPVGCVGPVHHDQISGRRLQAQVAVGRGPFYSTVEPRGDAACLEVATCISSGSLVATEVLRKVGGMREAFFIDQVDVEWCHRARAEGFRIFCAPQARLEHRLGRSSISFWLLGWRVHHEYPPERLYYRFRNFLLMARLPHVPLRWTIRAAGYWVVSFFVHVLLTRNRLANLRLITRGLLDGIRGRAGPFARRVA